MNNKRLERLKEMQKADPDDPFLRYAIANEHLAMGERKLAEAGFTALLEAHPDYLPTYYHFGKLLFENGFPQKAVTLWEKGISLGNEQGNRHTVNELRQILEDALDELEDD